jgi:hypothetical protein
VFHIRRGDAVDGQDQRAGDVRIGLDALRPLLSEGLGQRHLKVVEGAQVAAADTCRMSSDHRWTAASDEPRTSRARDCS